MKKLYIIPGYEETVRNQGYRRIVTEAKKKKYKIIILDLPMKGRLLSAVVREAIDQIGDGSDSTILGYSTGGLIAYCISKTIPIQKGLFCSLSPMLGEEIPKQARVYEKYFSKETVRELRKMKYGKSKAIEVMFFCGDKEGRKMIGRSKKLAEANRGVLTIISNNDHELNNDYLDIVLKAL